MELEDAPKTDLGLGNRGNSMAAKHSSITGVTIAILRSRESLLGLSKCLQVYYYEGGTFSFVKLKCGFRKIS